MSLVVFIVVAAAGAIAWWPLGRWPWARAATGIAALAACVLIAWGSPTSGLLTFGDEALEPTRFLRLWLLSAAGATLLLASITEAVGQPTRLAPAALVMLGGTAAALSVTDAGGALLVILATGTVVGLIALADRDAVRGPVRVEGLRVTVVVAVLALLGMAWGATGGLSLQPATTLVAFSLVAGALVLGTAAVPFHLPLTRLAQAVARPLVPLFVGWLPAALALVLLGWADARLVPLLPDLGPARAVLIALGMLTLGATSVAMLLQEDLGHVVTYAGIQGLAVAVLAYAAMDPHALPAARIALLLVPLWLSVLIGAVLVFDATSGTARVPALAGRLRRVPVTAAALAIAVLVAVGLPGLAGFDARRAISDLAAGPVLGAVGLLLGAASLAAWLRLGWVGLRPADQAAGAPRDAAAADWGAAERPTRLPANGRAGSPLSEGRALLEANRVPVAAALVLALAVLVLGLNLGVGHLSAAAQGPVPVASLRPTPTPGPTDSAVPTASPAPSGLILAPPATATPSPSASPSGSPTPGPSPTPGSSTGD